MSIETCCPVLELRQYTLHPGQRDTLIQLFDREFVESQEQLGMRVIGQFRDLDKPDRFVWLRGFHNMEVRDTALRAFYGGPVWAANSKAANATMIDASNVLLLRPARTGSGFRVDGLARAPLGTTKSPQALVVATICDLGTAPASDFIDFFDNDVMPAMADTVAARFVTDASANTFPALPVRTGENAFVWFSTFKTSTEYETHLARVDRSPHWRDEIYPKLRARLVSDPEVLRLSPTARSLLTYRI